MRKCASGERYCLSSFPNRFMTFGLTFSDNLSYSSKWHNCWLSLDPMPSFLSGDTPAASARRDASCVMESLANTGTLTTSLPNLTCSVNSSPLITLIITDHDHLRAEAEERWVTRDAMSWCHDQPEIVAGCVICDRWHHRACSVDAVFLFARGLCTCLVFPWW